MAQSVHLFLTANGEKIDGDSSQTSLERADSIECLSFDYGVQASTDSSGRSTGHRHYEPIRIVKRVDKSTPRLWAALCNNEAIEAKFKFYRPSPAGDGTTEHFYTAEITGARIAGIDLSSTDSSNDPPTEIVSFRYNHLVQTYEDGGISHNDHFREQA